ncbi:hypothetical protein ES702_00422 [subsurface metagenome]
MEELKRYAERKEFSEKVLRIGMLILFSLGIISVTVSIIIVIFTHLPLIIPGILGGAAFKSMIVFPLYELKKLANKKDLFYVYGVCLDKFPHLAKNQDFLNEMFNRFGRV